MIDSSRVANNMACLMVVGKRQSSGGGRQHIPKNDSEDIASTPRRILGE